MNIQWHSQETLLCDLLWLNSSKTHSYSVGYIRIKKKHKTDSSVTAGGLGFKMWHTVNAYG